MWVVNSVRFESHVSRETCRSLRKHQFNLIPLFSYTPKVNKIIELVIWVDVWAYTHIAHYSPPAMIWVFSSPQQLLRYHCGSISSGVQNSICAEIARVYACTYKRSSWLICSSVWHLSVNPVLPSLTKFSHSPINPFSLAPRAASIFIMTIRNIKSFIHSFS